MWTLSPRSLGGRLARHAGAAVALAMCIGLVACTGAETPPPAPTGKAHTIAPFPESGHIDAGTYLVTGYSVPFEITVPDGWFTYEGAAMAKDDPDHPTPNPPIQLTFWPAHHVPTDACAWRGALILVDPTAEAFVDAMTAQASTVSSPAVKLMVGDYPGFEFDHSVQSDVDISDCDGYKLCIFSDSAQDCDGSDYPTVDVRATYRAVDLNGERAVIALVHVNESIDPALAEEARAIFDSIAFAPEE